jgi:16S rRNA (guanine(966)-N(2))-methyltransferase RsmD
MLESILAAGKPGDEPGAEHGDVGTAVIWDGLVVADFYAGTGALGIEALSRGASWCDLFETDASARRVIELNLAATGFRDRARVFGVDVLRAVEAPGLAAMRRPYGVALLDPPYQDRSIQEVIAKLATGALFVERAIVAVEHSVDLPLAEVFRGALCSKGGAATLVQVRDRRHGDTVLSIYRLNRRDDRGVEDDGDHRDLSG